jgi:hypothetical protein
VEICFKNPRSKAPEINISRVAVRFYSRFFNDFSRSDKKKKGEKPMQGLLPPHSSFFILHFSFLLPPFYPRFIIIFSLLS